MLIGTSTPRFTDFPAALLSVDHTVCFSDLQRKGIGSRVVIVYAYVYNVHIPARGCLQIVALGVTAARRRSTYVVTVGAVFHTAASFLLIKDCIGLDNLVTKVELLLNVASCRV